MRVKLRTTGRIREYPDNRAKVLIRAGIAVQVPDDTPLNGGIRGYNTRQVTKNNLERVIKPEVKEVPQYVNQGDESGKKGSKGGGKSGSKNATKKESTQ